MSTRWVVCCIAITLLIVICQSYMFPSMRRRHHHRNRREANVEGFVEKWFSQRLDHFQPSNTATWKQRYWFSVTHSKKGGPVFLMLGAEGASEVGDYRDSTWVEFGKRYNARLIMLEHRFYGRSQPTRNMSVDNLRYLTSQQALADAAYFIESMNLEHKLPSGTKWIVFGGSYAGSLAAWLRSKYPHLVFGAVASSAPVLAKLDFREYYEVVEATISTFSKDCAANIKEANRVLKLLIQSDPKVVAEKLQLCEPIDTKDKMEVAELFDLLSDGITETVQYNSLARELHERGILNMCNIMNNKTLGRPVDRYYKLYLWFNNYATEMECKNIKYKMKMELFKNETFKSAHEMELEVDRQWIYQTCTEFGFYQTSEKKQDLFGEDMPLNMSTQMCSDIFGDIFTESFIQRAVDYTNIVYGGLEIPATRVIYVHGSVDPWHALGITKTRIPESPAIFINGSSHCEDMFVYKDSEIPALKDAQRKIYDIIAKWLA